jgi:hypothetical protein
MERTALLYESADHAFSLADLESTLAGVGLQLTHPLGGRPVILNQEGDARDSSREEVQLCIAQSDEVSFQWWFQADHALYCRIRRLAGAFVTEIGMNGTSASERADINSALLRRFELDHSRIGFVFDPLGASEDYEWDALFVYKQKVQWADIGQRPPELIGINKSNLDLLEPFPIGAKIIKNAEYILIKFDES